MKSMFSCPEALASAHDVGTDIHVYSYSHRSVWRRGRTKEGAILKATAYIDRPDKRLANLLFWWSYKVDS